MDKKFFSIFFAVLVAGCIFGGESPPPQVTYVTPCTVIGTGVTLRFNGTNLSSSLVRSPLSYSFTDDIVSDKAASWKGYYALSCDWGSNVGEIKDYYYCNGSYVAPDVNDQGVIIRKLQKQFKIGFSVDQRRGDTWIDLNGQTHIEPTFYDLTVRSIDAKCIVVY